MTVVMQSTAVRLAQRVSIVGALGLLASLAGGCTVGSGSGAASGPIYLLGCSPNGADYGEANTPKFYDLQPTFFAGDPTEEIGDVSVSQPANLLAIRMQRNGNRIEINDLLNFDILNSYEVARCVRGRTLNGVPDWYQRTTTSIFGETPTDTPWCDWSGTAQFGDGGASDGGASDGGTSDGGTIADAGDGGVRGTHAVIHLTTEDMVRASLMLAFTCHQANLIGVSFDGTIEFLDFGSAAQDSITNTDLRDPVPKDFKINFGDRLRARFHVVLQDQRIAGAIKMMMPVPTALMGGVIDGYFDFDLARGRGAQPFP